MDGKRLQEIADMNSQGIIHTHAVVELIEAVRRETAENARLRENWNIVRREAIRSLKDVDGTRRTLELMSNEEQR